MIKEYEEDDQEFCWRLLNKEGIPDDEMGFAQFRTFIFHESGMKKGFFSIRMENGLPYLVHFCVDRDFRDTKKNPKPGVAKRMILAFQDIIFKMGYRLAYLLVPRRTSYLTRIIGSYFKTKSFEGSKYQNVFLVEV